MLCPNLWVGLLILFGTILAEEVVPNGRLHYQISHVNDHISRNKRFGFSLLDEIRQKFCRSYCTSAVTMPYFANILCAVKCPELYLPHGTTMKSTTSMSPPTTTAPATTKKENTTVTSNITSGSSTTPASTTVPSNIPSGSSPTSTSTTGPSNIPSGSSPTSTSTSVPSNIPSGSSPPPASANG